MIIITIDLGVRENNYTCDGANINGLVLILSTGYVCSTKCAWRATEWTAVSLWPLAGFLSATSSQWSIWSNDQSPLNPVYCSAPDLCIPLITVIYFNPLTGYACCWLQGICISISMDLVCINLSLNIKQIVFETQTASLMLTHSTMWNYYFPNRGYSYLLFFSLDLGNN